MLEIKNLNIIFPHKNGLLHIVKGINFSLNKGENLAIVGESGSGKSVTALSILGLLDEAEISGEINYQNQNLLTLTDNEMRSVRGKEIAMIFQEPMTSLNPVFAVGKQIDECFLIQDDIKDTKSATIKILEEVGFADADKIYDKYPHQLSGGMRQRIMIAMALSRSPAILIADEPTTALDVTVQAQILSLLHDLQKTRGTSLILITHDLGVVAENTDRVLVMYHGDIVEECSTQSLITDGLKHPYTKALLDSAENMIPIRGNTIATDTHVKGCSFADRCPYAQEKCYNSKPSLEIISQNQKISCFYPYGGDK